MPDRSSDETTRAYDSQLRREQTERTRDRIIDAAHALLRTTRPVDLSYADVGARAEVSTRTVYRHFPTPDELFMAVAEKLYAEGLSSIGHEPRTVGDLAGALRRFYDLFVEDPALFRVMFATPSRSVMDQPKLFSRLFGPLLSQLSDEDRQSAFALLDLLGSPYAWDVAHHNWGLSAERGTRAFLVAMRALIDYLERNPRALSPDSEPPRFDQGETDGND